MTAPAQQWLGTYPATVYNTADPLGQNRIQMLVPQVLGTAVSQWATPVGLVSPSPAPAVGSVVHAMFLGGDVSHPGYTLPVQTPTLFASYDDEVAQDNPAAWWKLNEATGATEVLDYSGNNYNGTPTNVTFGGTGPVSGNTSAEFDGINARIVTTYTAPAFTSFSAEIWVNLFNVDPSTTAQLVGSANTNVVGDADANDGFSIQLNGTSPELWLGTGSGTTGSSLGPDLPASGWTLLTVTWNGTIVTCYQNGVTASTTNWSGPFGTSTNPVAIGASLGSGPKNWYNGGLAEVAIYTSALSVNRILAHFDARTGADAITASSIAASSVTTTTLDATTVTATTVDATTVVTSDVELSDGTGDYVVGHKIVYANESQEIETEDQNAINNLTVDVAAGTTYYFRASVMFEGLNTGALAYITMGGSCTTSSFRASINYSGPGQDGAVVQQSTFGSNTGMESNALTINDYYVVVVEGVITVTDAGTLVVEGATNSNTLSYRTEQPSTLYVSETNTDL